MQILLIMTTILMHGAEVVRSDEQDVLPTLVWIGCNHYIKCDLVQVEGSIWGGAKASCSCLLPRN